MVGGLDTVIAMLQVMVQPSSVVVHRFVAVVSEGDGAAHQSGHQD